jgi:hypothetical protein
MATFGVCIFGGEGTKWTHIQYIYSGQCNVEKESQERKERTLRRGYYFFNEW